MLSNENKIYLQNLNIYKQQNTWVLVSALLLLSANLVWVSADALRILRVRIWPQAGWEQSGVFYQVDHIPK